MRSEPARVPRNLLLLVGALPAMALLAVLPAGCGRDDAPTRIAAPGGAVPLRLSFRTAPRPAAAPVLGPVDTIRVALHDGFGEAVAPEAVVPIARNQTTFQVRLDAPSFTALEAVAVASGTRPVAGAPQGGGTGRGILYRASETDIVVTPGAESRATLTFEPFVTEFAGSTIDGDESTHLVWWGDLPGAAAWRVSRRVAGVLLPDTTVTDTMLFAVGLPVAYQVRAVDAEGRLGAPSDFRTLVPDLPPTPTGFDIAYAYEGDLTEPYIALEWNAIASGVESFEIHRSVEGDATFDPWTTTAATTTTATDREVADGLRYLYRIRSRRAAAVSPWAGPIGVEIPLSHPGRFRATPGRATILLQWDDRSVSETAIELERRVSDTGPFQSLARLDPDSKEFTDDKPPAGAPIQYRVRAVRGTQVSAWTGPITVVLQSP